MEHTNISLSYGIHRTPSIGNDGELSECVNLIPRAGELVNIIPPEQISGITLPTGAILQCLHHITADQADNYISYNAATGALYTQRPGSSTPSTPFATLSGITQLLTIGNSLIALGTDLTNYFIWKNGAYINLGSTVPEIPIQFGLRSPSDSEADERDYEELTTWVSLYDSSLSPTDEYQYQLPAADLVAMSQGNSPEIVTFPSSRQFRARLGEAVHAALRTAVARATEKNQFTSPFIVRYALRLYDGSHTRWSPPVLMSPALLPEVCIADYGESETAQQGHGKLTKDIHALARPLRGILDYALVDNINTTDWQDLITHIDIFVSPPIYFWDYDADPVAFMHKSQYSAYYGFENISIKKGNTEVQGESAVGKYAWREGVSFPDKFYEGEYLTGEMFDALDGEGGRVRIGFKTKTPPECKDAVLQACAAQYLLASLPITDLTTTRTDVPIPSYRLGNLTSQESARVSSDSHDTYTYAKGFSYNGRAIFYEAKRTRGVANVHPAVYLPYTNATRVGGDQTGVNPYGRLHLAAVLGHAAGNSAAVPNVAPADANASRVLTSWLTPAFLWLYLPDIDTEKVILEFIRNGQNDLSGEFITSRHPTLSGVYYFALSNPFDKLSQSGAVFPPAGQANVIYEPNRIFISDALNPFLIRETNAVTLDVGAIRAVSTATQALSQGQFGQFPLYAFTTDGIWALEVSSTGAISARQPVSRDVITEGTLPLQTDNAVVFITPAGLKLLSGSNAVLISGAVEGHNPDDTDYRVAREAYADINALLTASDTADFVAQLQTASLLYDYAQQLVHIFIPGLAKHYAFALDTHEWSTIVPPASSGGSAFPTAIVPAYPLSLLQYGTTLYRHTGIKSSGIPRPGVALTRPIALGDPTAMKALMDFRIIGQKTNQSTLRRMAIYVSNDGYQWRQLPTLKRGSFKYFRFLLLARLTDYDTLTGITVAHQLRRTNKLR